MSKKSDAEISRSHQQEYIFRIYDDKEYGINDNSDTDFIDEDDEDQHYSRKRATLIIGKLLLLELIDAYKTLSWKMHNIQ